jgi:hypothetical protein
LIKNKQYYVEWHRWLIFEDFITIQKELMHLMNR